MLKSIADKNDMEINDKSKIPCHPFPYLVAFGWNLREISETLIVYPFYGVVYYLN